MHELPTLQGERLILRGMDDDDATTLLEIYGDPLVMQYTDEAPFSDMATVGIMLQSVQRLLASGASLEWAIVLRGSGELIGTCGLHSFNAGRTTAEIGCLLKQSAWGKGYMAASLGLLTDYAQRIGLQQITADVASQNKRAKNLFKKLGYKQESPDLWRISIVRNHSCAKNHD